MDTHIIFYRIHAFQRQYTTPIVATHLNKEEMRREGWTVGILSNKKKCFDFLTYLRRHQSDSIIIHHEINVLSRA